MASNAARGINKLPGGMLLIHDSARDRAIMTQPNRQAARRRANLQNGANIIRFGNFDSIVANSKIEKIEAAGAIKASEKKMLGGVDQCMQQGRRNHARASLKYFAVSESGDARQDHITPVRQRARAIIQMSASKNDRSH